MNYIKEYKNSLRLEKCDSGRAYLLDVAATLSTNEIERLKVLKHHMRVGRYQHVLSVSYLSYMKAKGEGLRYIQTARAALLHDLYYYDWTQRDKRPKKHNRLHPSIALKNAESAFDLTPLEREIIASHMWPVVKPRPKSPEAKIVNKMDKLCSNLEIIYSFFSGKKSSVRYKKDKGESIGD